MKKCHVLWVVLLVSVLVVTFSFPAWGAKTIKIGVIGPMKFVQGIGHWNGAVLAAEQINAKGGVKVGDKMMQIELVQADSNEFVNVTDATNAMERLITQDRVNFVVGGFRTEAVLAMQDIAMENKVIFIVPDDAFQFLNACSNCLHPLGLRRRHHEKRVKDTEDQGCRGRGKGHVG
jgi:branched-chain amino acid transport system substrate-binding protein